LSHLYIIDIILSSGDGCDGGDFCGGFCGDGGDAFRQPRRCAGRGGLRAFVAGGDAALLAQRALLTFSARIPLVLSTNLCADMGPHFDPPDAVRGHAPLPPPTMLLLPGGIP